MNILFGAKKAPKKPAIDSADLTIRELKHNDKYDMFHLVGDFRKAYYITIYKLVFRSWFTYVTSGILLGLSMSLMSSSLFSICLPPIIITLFLLWKVNRFKRMNYLPNVNDMEEINQVETSAFKFKSNESRRINQGVLIVFAKDESKMVDNDLLLDYDEDDDEEAEDEEAKSGRAAKAARLRRAMNPNRKLFEPNERNRKLVGYLVYAKQKDELETVCIKELCIHADYRQRKVATNFLRRACENIFQTYGYRRVTFQVSSFHRELKQICAKKEEESLLNKIWSWTAYEFVPGVKDERVVYNFDIAKLVVKK